MDIEFSNHARNMIALRSIREEWVYQAISVPDRIEFGMDENTHYIKAIDDYGGRFLRVVVNRNANPNRIVTLFFDRRIRRTI